MRTRMTGSRSGFCPFGVVKEFASLRDAWAELQKKPLKSRVQSWPIQKPPLFVTGLTTGRWQSQEPNQ